MDFKTTIQEIQNSIKQREFLNEAEVTNGIVLRILNEVGWNTFDTKKVKPQYNIDNKKIDLVLCFPDNKPIIIIEVKGLGKAVNSDEQMLTYSFKMGIPIAILTDGQEWHFYLPAERGSLTERRFYKLDLLERNTEEIIETFKDYLLYESVKNNSAIDKAKNDYNKQYKNKELNNSIPKAWNKLIQDRDRTLIDLLSEKVADICGFEPSEEVVLDFLKNMTNPTESIRPATNAPQIKIALPPENVKRGMKGVIINGEKYQTRNAIGTLETLLEIAIKNYPNALIKIETQTQGRSRSLISRQKSNLYLNNSELTEKFTKQLPNNWWFGTNYSKREIERFCNIVAKSIQDEYNVSNIEWEI